MIDEKQKYVVPEIEEFNLNPEGIVLAGSDSAPTDEGLGGDSNLGD